MKLNFNPQALINQFNSLDVKARCAAFGVFVLMIVALDYFLIMEFQIAGMRKIDETVKKMSVDTVQVKGDMQRINEIKQGVEATRLKMQVLNNKIRPVQEAPAVLEDISRAAVESGVNIDQIVPAKTGMEALKTIGDIKYSALPIVIGAHSGYHMFGRFLDKLESGNVLFMLKDLRMEGNEKDPTRPLLIKATLNVVLWDTATAADKKPAGTKK